MNTSGDKPEATHHGTSVDRILDQVDMEAAVGCDWWDTDTTSLVIGVMAAGPAAAVFTTIARLLSEGEDPDVIVGDSTASAAFTVGQEWIDAGIDPSDVEGWLRAGCWKPTVAKTLTDAGLQPRHLLSKTGRPLHWIDVPTPNGEKMPLARAVTEEFLSGTSSCSDRHGPRTMKARTRSGRRRAALVGNSNGPTGWTVSDGSGAARPVTLEALLCLEHQLRADDEADAADDLDRQITTLARVAEAWRHVDHDRHRPQASRHYGDRSWPGRAPIT